MKKNVILYVRVSTDEQAENGYSRPAQLEKLRKFCLNKGWNILIEFKEDFTAWKGFERPAYLELRKYIKQNKNKVDYVLVTQWSRFSRDSAAAHIEIRDLKKLGIEVNAAEQWIDFGVPESQYMLAFYLAAPQVENDRLSLRVKDALRKALKDGKLMGKAPYGYVNDKLAKLIHPDPSTSHLVKFVFETFGSGAYTIAEVRRMAVDLGVTIKKAQFIKMLSNPFYKGRIFVPAKDDEPETYVKGIHEAIIDDETFDAVQLVLKGRSKPYKGKTKGDELPLKGSLICPICGKVMTGSASKGNGGHYHYYHCQRKYGCKNAYPAKPTNEKFEKLLASYKVKEGVLALFYRILEDVFKTNDTNRLSQKLQLEHEIKKMEASIKSLDDKMISGELPTERYNRLIEPIERKKTEMEIQYAALSKSNNELKQYLDFSFSLLADIQEYYSTASLQTKQKMVGSIFPENLVFDGKEYRTTRVNEVFALICSTGKGLKEKQPNINARLSTLAPPAGLEPATL